MHNFSSALTAFLLFFFFVVVTDYKHQVITRVPTLYAFAQDASEKDMYRVRYSVPMSGTGSMDPTIPIGKNPDPKARRDEIVAHIDMYPYPLRGLFLGEPYTTYQIKHGDIVSFINDQTRAREKADGETESHDFVKRVIGLANDRIEIREGLVYRNGEPLLEPYIKQARSTFGTETFQECTTLQIPSNHAFVLGDNRKGSYDSRFELGLVNISDIDAIIPLSKQQGVLDQHWRDTSDDLSDTAKIKLDTQHFLTQLNSLRQGQNLQKLTSNAKLVQSATIRGKEILQDSDLEFEDAQQQTKLSQSFKKVGYSNIVWGELYILGYYDSEELYDSLFGQGKQTELLLDSQMQEIGISALEALHNNCPTQIITIHTGGYLPAQYDTAIVQSWRRGLNELLQQRDQTRDSLQEISVGQPELRNVLEKILHLFDERVQILSPIVQKLENSQWLTESERAYLESGDAQKQTEQQDLFESLK